MSKTDTTNPVELLEKAAETCFQAMKEGLKMQEQSADRWFQSVKDASGSEDWLKRIEEISTKATSQAKDTAEEVMKLMEQGSRDGMALFNKALEIGGVATPGEAQVKTQQLWQESLNVLNANAKAMAQANSKMLKAWGEMAKENVEKATKKA